ncbi:MAG: hypothetical protein ACXVBE_04030 [Bdellovibrionota bacterium]
MLLFLLLFSALTFAEDAPRLPPKVLYHFGKKAHLLQDAELDTIPEDVWDNSIMSGESRYSLMPFRRGLYGGESIGIVEGYGDMYLSEKPWLMAIHVKDSCRDPENIVPLEKDHKFGTWLMKNPTAALMEISGCLNMAAESCDDIMISSKLTLTFHDRQENRCEKMLNAYYDESEIKLIADKAHPDSWYIRDRSCIEKIDGSPKELLEIFGEMDWSKENRGGGIMPRGAGSSSIFTILYDALADEGRIDPALADKLRTKAAGSDIAFYDSTWAALKEKRGSQKWLSDNVPILLDAFQRCEAKGKMAEFRSLAKGYQERIRDDEFKNSGFGEFPPMIWEQAGFLGKACR